jgi:hypothetical protein
MARWLLLGLMLAVLAGVGCQSAQTEVRETRGANGSAWPPPKIITTENWWKDELAGLDR